MLKLPTVEELFDAGAHFGHQKAKSHPKSRESVYSIVNGVYIINLDKSHVMLEQAVDYIKKQTAVGRVPLLVGTKRQAKEAVEKIGKSLSLPYVTTKWLGGALTNFTTIKLNLKKLEGLEAEMADPGFAARPKKAQAMVITQVNRLHKTLDGMKNLDKLPDYLIVIDSVEEKTAVTEAKKLGLPVVGIIDTNANPATIDYPIVVNDDSFKTIELVLKTIGDAIADTKRMLPKTVEKVESGIENQESSKEPKTALKK